MKQSHDFQLLVDSDEFISDLESRILSAQERVLVQAMTFEADTAGTRLYDALSQSVAKEKILCVDAYSLANINDGWAFGWRYLVDRNHRKEVNETRNLLKCSDDIQVVITNPLGFLGVKYPFRNHKKMMIVDDVAYLGGINFSDHNFSWHDVMVRITDTEIVNELSQDFKCTCEKVNQNFLKEINASKLYFFDGINSKNEYANLFEEIQSAKSSISVLSPYVSDPLLGQLMGLKKEVDIKFITPSLNNKSLMKNALLEKIRNSDFRLFEREGEMSHLKAILVDDTKLIIGSSNFDAISYYLEQEVVLITYDKLLIDQFKVRVLNPDLEKSNEVDLRKIESNTWSLFLLNMLKKIVPILAYIFLKKK